MNTAVAAALPHADPHIPLDHYHRDEIGRAMHRAARDITDAVDLPDTGTRDALNLLINATLHYLGGTGQETLADVVAAMYDLSHEEDDGLPPLQVVLGWLR